MIYWQLPKSLRNSVKKRTEILKRRISYYQDEVNRHKNLLASCEHNLHNAQAELEQLEKEYSQI